MRPLLPASLIVLLASSTASAQVYITEVQPNPPGDDLGEYVEIHNTSTVAVSIDGWTISDYSGNDPAGETMTQWAFPALASIGAGQVIVIARQSAIFLANTTMRPTYEMAIDAPTDDAMVPNLIPSTGNTFQLVNGATGDGVLLKDAMGTIVDGVEYGNIDRSVPGIPQSQVPGDGESLNRVAATGSSNVDFRVGAPSPFVGFVPMTGPIIGNQTWSPPHLRYGGDDVMISTMITDMAGVSLAEIYLTTATSSTGDATLDYASISMTATTAGSYTFSAPINNLGPGIAPANPASFHDLYMRYYIYAENGNGQASTDPANAVETQDNEAFHQRNVMPRDPSPIAAVREQDMNDALVWIGHSATVRGVALVKRDILTPNRLDLALEDESGMGIRVFGDIPMGMGDVDVGDIVEATGTITQFRGVAELAGDNVIISLPGGTSTVSVTTVTIADLLSRAEELESRLVLVEDVDFVEPTTNWPGMGTGGNVTVSDGTGMITVRVTSASELFNQPAPQYGFSVRGILGQFASELTGTQDGYQILPRIEADIVAKPMPPPPDAGPQPDSGPGGPDAGPRPDAGPGVDSGTGGPGPDEDDGCGCTAAEGTTGDLAGALLALAFAGLLALRRRGA